MVAYKFETKPVKDENASVTAGRAVMKDEDWVKILVDHYTAIQKPVDMWLKDLEWKVQNGRATPEELNHANQSYTAFKAGKEPPINGTDLRHWGMLTPAQAENLRAAGVMSVEHFADAPENILGVLGMGARELQRKAKAYLDASDGKIAEKMTALEQKLETVLDRCEALEEENKALKTKKGKAA